MNCLPRIPLRPEAGTRREGVKLGVGSLRTNIVRVPRSRSFRCAFEHERHSRTSRAGRRNSVFLNATLIRRRTCNSRLNTPP